MADQKIDLQLNFSPASPHLSVKHRVLNTLDKCYERTLVLRDQDAFEALMSRHSEPLKFFVTPPRKSFTLLAPQNSS